MLWNILHYHSKPPIAIFFIVIIRNGKVKIVPFVTVEEWRPFIVHPLTQRSAEVSRPLKRSFRVGYGRHTLRNNHRFNMMTHPPNQLQNSCKCKNKTCADLSLFVVFTPECNGVFRCIIMILKRQEEEDEEVCMF